MITESLYHMLAGTFTWAWKTSLYASVLIVLVWTIQLLLKKKLTAKWHYAFGCVILVRLLLPAVPESSISIFNLTEAPPALSTMESITYIDSSISPVESEHYLPVVQAPRAWRLSDLLMFGWAGGVFILLSQMLRHQFRLNRWVNQTMEVPPAYLMGLLEECKGVMDVQKPVRMLVKSRFHTAALLGWRKPCLLLPENMIQSMKREEVRLVILHELAHVKRNDILLNWIMILVQSIHWFNPMIWMAMKRFRADRELVCDDMVMKHLSPVEQTLYGETLIKLLSLISKSRAPMVVATVIDGKQQLKRRMIMISKRILMGRTIQSVMLALLAGLVSITFTGAIAEDRERDREDRDRKHDERQERHGEHIRDFENKMRRMGQEVKELRQNGQNERAEEVAHEMEKMKKHFQHEMQQHKRHAEMQHHGKEIEHKNRILREKAEDVERALRELEGKDGEEAEAKRRKLHMAMREIESNHRKLEEYQRKIHQEGNRDRDHDPRHDMERRLRHLHEAAENLKAAGLHEEAKHVWRRAEEMKHHMRERSDRDREHHPERDHDRKPSDMEHHVRELTEVVKDLQREMQNMRKEMHRLREGDR